MFKPKMSEEADTNKILSMILQYPILLSIGNLG